MVKSLRSGGRADEERPGSSCGSCISGWCYSVYSQHSFVKSGRWRLGRFSLRVMRTQGHKDGSAKGTMIDQAAFSFVGAESVVLMVESEVRHTGVGEGATCPMRAELDGESGVGIEMITIKRSMYEGWRGGEGGEREETTRRDERREGGMTEQPPQGKGNPLPAQPTAHTTTQSAQARPSTTPFFSSRIAHNPNPAPAVAEN